MGALEVENEHTVLGRFIIDDHRLAELREHLGFSVNLMSELLHVNAMTYRKWENGTGESLRPVAAERIGRFYQQVIDTLEKMKEEGLSIENLIPFHLVAAAAGMPQEVLMTRCRDGNLDCVDLGILGLWLPRSQLKVLGVDE